jgi:hypothetical protein
MDHAADRSEGLAQRRRFEALLRLSASGRCADQLEAISSLYHGNDTCAEPDLRSRVSADEDRGAMARYTIRATG